MSSNYYNQNEVETQTGELYSTEAEQGLLGCILIEPYLYESIKELIDEDDFFLKINQDVWHAMGALADGQVEPEIKFVEHWLLENGKLKDAERSYVSGLLTATGSSSNAQQWAEIIRGYTVRRLQNTLANLWLSASRSADGRVTAIEAKIAAISEVLQDKTNHQVKDPWGEPRTLKDASAPHSPVEFIVEEVFRRPSLNMIFGSQGDLKSMLMIYMHVCIAGGVPILTQAPWKPGGHTFTVKQVPTLYLDFDMGIDDVEERFDAVRKALNLPEDISCYYYSFPPGGFDAGNKKQVGALAERIDRLGAQFVTLDNLGIIKGAADENSDQMIPVMNNLRWVAEQTRIVETLIHHQRKPTGYQSRSGDTIRGHGSIAAALNLGLLVDRDQDSSIITISQAKKRNNEVPPFTAEFTYTHKEGLPDLDTATFFSVPTAGAMSLKAMDDAIIEALAESELDKSQLTSAVRELIPDLKINEIRDRIDYLDNGKKLGVRVEKHNRHVYFNV